MYVLFMNMARFDPFPVYFRILELHYVLYATFSRKKNIKG
jgi:hypothetical protein